MFLWKDFWSWVRSGRLGPLCRRSEPRLALMRREALISLKVKRMGFALTTGERQKDKFVIRAVLCPAYSKAWGIAQVIELDEGHMPCLSNIESFF